MTPVSPYSTSSNYSFPNTGQGMRGTALGRTFQLVCSLESSGNWQRSWILPCLLWGMRNYKGRKQRSVPQECGIHPHFNIFSFIINLDLNFIDSSLHRGIELDLLWILKLKYRSLLLESAPSKNFSLIFFFFFGNIVFFFLKNPPTHTHTQTLYKIHTQQNLNPFLHKSVYKLLASQHTVHFRTTG